MKTEPRRAITADARDLLALREAGITDPAALIGAAADFVRRHSIRDRDPGPNPLPEREEAFLRACGADGLDGVTRAGRDNLARVAGEYAQLVASALSVGRTAERLGTSPSRVRQLILERSLYAFDGPSGRVLPRFQFAGDGALPGLAEVLRAINPEAHPLAVESFFLEPTPDLEPERAGEALSPRDWLLSGRSVQPVLALAREL